MRHSSERRAVWAVVDIRGHPLSRIPLGFLQGQHNGVPSDHYCVGALLLLGTLGLPSS